MVGNSFRHEKKDKVASIGVERELKAMQLFGVFWGSRLSSGGLGFQNIHTKL